MPCTLTVTPPGRFCFPVGKQFMLHRRPGVGMNRVPGTVQRTHCPHPQACSWVRCSYAMHTTVYERPWCSPGQPKRTSHNVGHCCDSAGH